MLSLTTSDITRAFVNATRSEIAATTFPRNFPSVPWAELDFYGWRDPRIERRGYLVIERGDGLITVAVSTAGQGVRSGRKAMCTVCRAVDDGSNIALFSARRAGPAGRRGDSVGTYLCAGLDCSAQLRFPTPRGSRTMLPDGHATVDDRAAAMMERLRGFLDSVLA